jgi:hypothetical protein
VRRDTKVDGEQKTDVEPESCRGSDAEPELDSGGSVELEGVLAGWTSIRSQCLCWYSENKLKDLLHQLS